ncbi:MAG: ATP-binding protein [Oscillospiraceae bacterium]|nr:ATP-binding protein [Oscillospiraceae bacterium]
MILLIAGASHTGKTALAQRLLEKYGFPYLSIDHLKMGLIRSGNTTLTPDDDKELTDYLWPIVSEIVKTAVENDQNLIIEGCYIPYDWEKSFEKEYLRHIKYRCLIMSEAYIRGHYDEIRGFASVIEGRGDDPDCTMETLLRDNAEALKMCRLHNADYLLIDGTYDVDIEL